MKKRTPFPPVFWVANTIEVLERFAYYGIYFGFGIYMSSLGYSMGQLGIVQSLFLVFSYSVPVISGTFADRYGFKKVLIISYLAYLPSILLLTVTRSFSGIALAMLSVGLAAGIFKPLIAATVRCVTDKTNKTLGFGIFYAMVNVGGSFGPLVAGKLRILSWNYTFYMAAAFAVIMLLVTIFFYKEPERELGGVPLKQKLKDIGATLSDVRFAVFLVILGVFFWLPFWAFFNLLALYVDKFLDTAQLYRDIKSVFGAGFADFLSNKSKLGEDGVLRILGETISHTGYIIVIFQLFVTRMFERFRAIGSFMVGLVIVAAGFGMLGYAKMTAPAWVFLGIFLFAVGEMICSPRIQEYITWLAPKEKAGLYMGSNFLALGMGAGLSGIYTYLFGKFIEAGHPERIWFVLAGHILLCLLVMFTYTKTVGEFQEMEE